MLFTRSSSWDGKFSHKTHTITWEIRNVNLVIVPYFIYKLLNFKFFFPIYICKVNEKYLLNHTGEVEGCDGL